MAFKILLVDDNPIVREAFGLVLRRDGFNVDTASSADEAATMLAGADFDAVVTDLRMPGHDGLWLLEQVKAAQPGCYCVLMSGDANVDPRRIIERAEVDRFFVKPVDRAELAAALRSVREQRQAM